MWSWNHALTAGSRGLKEGQTETNFRPCSQEYFAHANAIPPIPQSGVLGHDQTGVRQFHEVVDKTSQRDICQRKLTSREESAGPEDCFKRRDCPTGIAKDGFSRCRIEASVRNNCRQVAADDPG